MTAYELRISDWRSDVFSSYLIGDLPISGETELNAAILTQSRFTTPEQFGNIILRANPDGSAVTLSDVARVELGAQTYLFDSELNGKPVAALAVQMTPGANALATAEAVKTRMAQLAETFPSDINWTEIGRAHV